MSAGPPPAALHMGESLLAQLQRLEGIGQLSRGLAHDFNNAFSAVLMGTALLREQTPPEALRYLDGVEASARRGTDLVHQLRSYVKGVAGERVLLDPRFLLRELEKSLRSTLPKTITVQSSLAEDTPPILGEPAMLQQALGRLVERAQPLCEGSGRIRLEAYAQVLDDAAAQPMRLGPGKYACLRVRDTTPLTDPTAVDESLPGGRFATAQAIIHEHGGALTAEAVPGAGNCVTIYLPAARTATGVTAPAETVVGAGRWVLVVDDEAPVRVTMRNHLQSLGFHVLEAADGPEALVRLATAPMPVTVAICDLHLTSLDGPSLCRWLRQLAPDLALVGLSEPLAKASADELQALGILGAMGKPYTLPKLAGALQGLESPRTPKSIEAFS
ncbi:MAG: response regulator [Proteobacteria bacterium]|nr:response regulator [Pseudomonadota bacterium]